MVIIILWICISQRSDIFSLNPDPDLDPSFWLNLDPGPGFWWPKMEVWSCKKLILLKHKIAIHLVFSLLISTKAFLTPVKLSLFYFCFGWGPFEPSGSGSTDPTASGSERLPVVCIASPSSPLPAGIWYACHPVEVSMWLPANSINVDLWTLLWIKWREKIREPYQQQQSPYL